MLQQIEKPKGAIWLSASQLSNSDCIARWGFDKLAKLPRGEEGAMQIFGQRVHDGLAWWGLNGNVVSLEGTLDEDVLDAVYSVVAAKKMPGPVNGVFYEGQEHEGLEAPYMYEVPDRGNMFVLPVPHVHEGCSYIGFKDLLDIRQLESESTIHVRDWKCRSKKQYIVEPDDLRTDYQALMYCYLAHKQFPQARTITFGHHNIIVSSPHARTGKRRVQDIVTKATSYKVYEREFGTLVEKMHTRAMKLCSIKEDFANGAASTTREALAVVNDLPKDLEKCYQYGRCDYADVCKKSKADRIRSIQKKEKKKMGLLDDIKAKKSGAKTTKKKTTKKKTSKKGGSIKDDLEKMNRLKSLAGKGKKQEDEPEHDGVEEQEEEEQEEKPTRKKRATKKKTAKKKTTRKAKKEEPEIPEGTYTLLINAVPLEAGYVTVEELFESVLRPSQIPWDLSDPDTHHAELKKQVRAGAMDIIEEGLAEGIIIVADRTTNAWSVLGDILMALPDVKVVRGF